MLFFYIYFCRTYNSFYKLLLVIVISNKNKRIDDISNIMSKSHCIFAENFTLCFLNAEKTGNVPEFEAERF